MQAKGVFRVRALKLVVVVQCVQSVQGRLVIGSIALAHL